MTAPGGPARTLEIVDLGAQGDGVARAEDGSTVFVPGSLPGDRALATPGGDRAEIIELRAPSPHRVQPPCPHAEACGGCALQHADLDFLAQWKRARIIDALARQGLETEVLAAVQSPQRSRRRASFAAVRGKRAVMLGFHRRRDRQVVDAPECRLIRPEIAAALPALKDLARLAAPRSRGVRLTVTLSEDGLDVAVAEAKPLDLGLTARAAAWAEQADAARLSWNEETIAMRRPPRQRFGRAHVVPPPGGFLQATEEGEAAIWAAASPAFDAAKKTADLFAGSGAFALRMAERSEVSAVDGDAAAVDALNEGWRGSGGALKRVTANARDLFRRPLRVEELKGLDAVLLDPPRAGAEAQARELAGAGVPRVVGVSCDPTSFARDAAILTAGGFQLTRVTPIDQFLWSTHIELVGMFER